MTQLPPPPGEFEWTEFGRTPLPVDHPIVKNYGMADEVIYPGLGVIDWQEYLGTIQSSDREAAASQAARTLFLTTKRVIVVDNGRMLMTSLLLSDIENVSVDEPPGTMGLTQEAMIQVQFRAGEDLRAVGWSTRKHDAKVFVERLRDLIAFGT